MRQLHFQIIMRMRQKMIKKDKLPRMWIMSRNRKKTKSHEYEKFSGDIVWKLEKGQYLLNTESVQGILSFFLFLDMLDVGCVVLQQEI